MSRIGDFAAVAQWLGWADDFLIVDQLVLASDCACPSLAVLRAGSEA